MNDEQIIAAFLTRDETAITGIRDFYGSYCAAIARNILNNEADIEEVLNDTWLRAWNSIPPQKPENLKLYLARITRNLSYDRFRTQTREKRGGKEATLALHELSECIPAPGTPENVLEAAELRQAINDFLGTCSQRDRSVFLLRYFYLESMDAITLRFGIRPGLVRTILSRTRRKLKHHLEKEGLF